MPVAAGGPTRSRRAEFLAHNRKLRAEVLDWEARLRKRDLFVGEPGVAAFYDARLPAGVHDRATLATWCATAQNDRALRMTAGDVASRDPGELTAERYPNELEFAGQQLPLRYRFEPGAENDGLTLEVPRTLLGALRPEQIDWLVPGWLGEKVVALLRALPKELRRPLVPLPDTAAELLAKLEPRRGRQSLTSALREALADGSIRKVGRVALDAALLDERALRAAPRDADRGARRGRAACSRAGRDLRALQREWLDAGGVRAASGGGDAFTRTNVAHWDFGDLPDTVALKQAARDVQLYPSLLDVHGRVDLRLLPPGPSAVEQHRRGVRRLLLKNVPQQVALMRERTLEGPRARCSRITASATSDALVDDVVLASADESFALVPPIRTRAAFAAALDAGRAELVAQRRRAARAAARRARCVRELRRELDAASGKGAQPRVRDEIAAQLAALVGAVLLSAMPPEWRKHLPRYLRAARARWEKRGQRRDAELAAADRGRGRAARALARRVARGWPWPAAVVEYRWLLEELRVSLFAQQLGTSRPVSPKRLEQAWRRALEQQPAAG